MEISGRKETKCRMMQVVDNDELGARGVDLLHGGDFFD
jgi:hypothetical protein